MRFAGLPPHAGLVVGALLLASCGEPSAASTRALSASRAEPRPIPTGEALAARLGCGSCHPGVGAGEPAGGLPVADPALDPAAVFAYLMDPPAPAEGAARMPDFRLTDAEAAALALNIAAGEPGSAGADATALRTLMREQPVVRDTTVARRIRVALRCDACHEGTAAQAAPPLPRAAEGLQRDWLRTFLQSPHTVRPLGWRPGSATRMPGFALSATELDSLLAWLAPDTSPSTAIEPISDRLRDNTLTLMRDRWSCMGCHAWNGEGGRIGPDLAETGSRLTTRRIRAMLEDPSTTVPGTIMPKALLQPREVDRIVAVLTHARGAGHGDPVSPLDAETFDPATGEDAAGIYDRTCAVCHGRDGRGDGVHAMMLDAPPAVHADSAAMSARPDDTLYDGIAAGGRILGGSDDMPAFGGSLPPETIRALVAHIRTLCDCTGPQWSRDDGVRR